jgi:16S rRNA (cytidine1402-2'-O)-methyltransferase
MLLCHVGHMLAPLPPGLYIVATPIGNMADLTRRGESVLAQADVILVEDSRVTGKLLHQLGIKAAMRRYDDHAEARDRSEILHLLADKAVALVSDAGTPLVSDPGYKLVRDARAAGHKVTSVPGPSAPIAALTLSGLPSDRFLFLGFLPNKRKARREAFAEFTAVRATLILFENAQRLGAMLDDGAAVLGDRPAAVVREISKKFEEVIDGPLSQLAARFADNPPKGEIVVVIGPPLEQESPLDADMLAAALRAALVTLSPSQAAGQVAKRFGGDRKALYALAQQWKADETGGGDEYGDGEG